MTAPRRNVHPPPGEPRLCCDACGHGVRMRVRGHEGKRLCLACAAREVDARGPVALPEGT